MRSTAAIVLVIGLCAGWAVGNRWEVNDGAWSQAYRVEYQEALVDALREEVNKTLPPGRQISMDVVRGKAKGKVSRPERPPRGRP